MRFEGHKNPPLESREVVHGPLSPSFAADMVAKLHQKIPVVLNLEQKTAILCQECDKVFAE